MNQAASESFDDERNQERAPRLRAESKYLFQQEDGQENIFSKKQFGNAPNRYSDVLAVEGTNQSESIYAG